ncbi:hypothetical protein NP493_812g02013 [Ridgeia piscesae]|uniref:Reverse transcriptase domain-containing protein n=1 Tax=Ridgeia piscesae TaxID=27915 RepID=A0AAD9KMZ3_RIDPI|nr:hypothetical protein NP493_812g02013 [Ridgeia piscesae]
MTRRSPGESVLCEPKRPGDHQADVVRSSHTKLFADDCLLFKSITTDRDQQALQSDLSSLEQWEKDWQMEFNPGKCTAIRVMPKKTKLMGQPRVYQRVSRYPPQQAITMHILTCDANDDSDAVQGLVDSYVVQLNDAMNDAVTEAGCKQKHCNKPKTYWCPELSHLRDRKRFWW